jgi:hypothetical protein
VTPGIAPDSAEFRRQKFLEVERQRLAIAKHDPSAAFQPNRVQKAALKLLDEGIRAGCLNFGILPGNGCGKCLGKGTPVLMFDGTTRAVETILPGELLMGPDSKPRTVLSVATGREKMYRIIPNNGNPFECNASHVLSLKRTSYGKLCDGRPSDHWKRGVKNLSVTEYLGGTKTMRQRYRLYKTGVEFCRRAVSVHPYFLGLWLGDGHSDATGVTTGDWQIEKFLREYAKSLQMNVRVVKGSGCHSFMLSKGWRNALLLSMKAIGVIGNKHIPHAYKANSRDIRLALLAGLLDSDGYSAAYGTCFCNSNKILAEDVLWLARSLGFRATLSRKTTSIKSIGYKGEAWTVMIGGKVSEIPVLLSRKLGKDATSYDKLISGFKIEDIGDGNYFGFELDGDGLFLLGDFTVTHNTTLLAVLLRQISIGSNNPHFDLDFIRHWPFRKELRIVCDAADMKDDGALYNALYQWWPKGSFQSEKQGYDIESLFRMPNGFTLSVRTFDQPKLKHESSSLGAVFFNEPPVSDARWKQYGARLRGTGFRSLWGTVWDDDQVWVQDSIIENPECRYMTGDLHDCCRDCFADGHMSHSEIMAQIRQYEQDYGEEIATARRSGVFQGISSRVFHVIPEAHFYDHDDPEDLSCFASLDPHPHKPWVYLTGGIDASGDWWILDEWPHETYNKITSDLRGLGEYAQIIKDNDAKWEVKDRVIDRRGSAQNIRKSYGSTTVRQDLERDYRLKFRDGNPHVQDSANEIGGVTFVKNLLRHETERGIYTKLHISSRCRNLRFQLARLSRKKDSEGRVTSDVDDEFLDFPRALMYLVMAGFKHRTGASAEEIESRRMSAREREINRIRHQREMQEPEVRSQVINWYN